MFIQTIPIQPKSRIWTHLTNDDECRLLAPIFPVSPLPLPLPHLQLILRIVIIHDRVPIEGDFRHERRYVFGRHFAIWNVHDEADVKTLCSLKIFMVNGINTGMKLYQHKTNDATGVQ